MSTLVVIQARMGSTRLPGKVAADVGGRPLLGLMLHRLRDLAADHLVVATSTAPADDRVSEIASAAGVEVVRGSEHDVLDRFATALERHPADVVVRLTADCPLADPEIVAATVARLEATGADYASNTLVRTYPDGLDVEALPAEVLRTAAAEASAASEREHVTPFVYRRPRRFALTQLTTDALAGDERWTIDTADDLEWLRRTIARHPEVVADPWLEVLRLLGRRALCTPGEVHLVPVASPAATKAPFVRRWRAELDSTTIGAVEVTVDEGAGRWRADVAAEHRPAVRAALVHALGADAQVERLEDG